MTTPIDPDLISLTGPWGSLAVNRRGATVSSWRPGGVERLFTSRDADPAQGRMWHGGIPLCAPWFGQGIAQGWAVPFSHGLVSRTRWDVVDFSEDASGAQVTLTTDATATAHLQGSERFPRDLSYRLDVTADADALTLALMIASPTADAVVDAVFHPYLATDAREETIDTLAGIAFHDYATGSDGVDADPVSAAGPVDRVYADARPVRLPHAGLLLDGAGADTMVVWNPGPGGSQVADEWARFVCVEYGVLARPIPAGGMLSVALALTVR